MPTLKQIHDGMIDRRSYWSLKNYYADGSYNFGAINLSSWKEFRNEDWTVVESDWDENLICGWFLEDLEDNDFRLIVYSISPRKGKFIPLIVDNVTDGDAPEIVQFIADVAKKQAEHWSINGILTPVVRV